MIRRKRERFVYVTHDNKEHSTVEAAKDHLREEYLDLCARVHKRFPDGGHDVLDKLLDNIDLIMRWATVSKDYHEDLNDNATWAGHE